MTIGDFTLLPSIYFFLDVLDMQSTILQLTSTASIISLSWNTTMFADEDQLLWPHYDYNIMYKSHIDTAWNSIFVEASRTDIQEDVINLEHNTNYRIKVVPFRNHKSNRLSGIPTAEYSVKTTCKGKSQLKIQGAY